MTPTTSEREALVEMQNWLDEGWEVADRNKVREWIAALTREQREGVTDEMVARFLGWKLPADFAPDCGITFEPVGNKGTRFEYRFEPVGTNLLTAVQARAMLEYVLATGAPTAQQPLDGPANNAGVATGSRNGPPSESVTRGNLPPSIPQQEAQGAVASAEDAGEFQSDTAALAFLRVIGKGNPNIERAVERLRLSLTTQPAPVDVRRLLLDLDDGIEDMELNGMHDAPGYRKIKAAYKALETALLDGQQAGVDWIERAAVAGREIAALLGDDCPGVQCAGGNEVRHLCWMAQQLAEKRVGSETKACRWLGYLQAGLVFSGHSTLEAEKQRNLRSAALGGDGVR